MSGGRHIWDEIRSAITEAVRGRGCVATRSCHPDMRRPFYLLFDLSFLATRLSITLRFERPDLIALSCASLGQIQPTRLARLDFNSTLIELYYRHSHNSNAQASVGKLLQSHESSQPSPNEACELSCQMDGLYPRGPTDCSITQQASLANAQKNIPDHPF